MALRRPLGAALPAAFALAALLARPALAAPPAEDNLVRIDHAEEATYDAAGRVIRLAGDVRVRRGALSIRADRIVLYLDTQGRQIETGVAAGDVRIKEGLRTATAERAELLAGGDKVVLTGGPPRLVEGTNEIVAERIEYTFSTRRLEAKGSVRGVVVTGERPPGGG